MDLSILSQTIAGEDIVIPSSLSEGCSHDGESNQRDSPSREMKVTFLGELGLVPMSESAKRGVLPMQFHTPFTPDLLDE